MIADPGLAEILAAIIRADAIALGHDRMGSDQDAQRADEAAQEARREARAMIEAAFPGVSWSMIERAFL